MIRAPEIDGYIYQCIHVGNREKERESVFFVWMDTFIGQERTFSSPWGGKGHIMLFIDFFSRCLFLHLIFGVGSNFQNPHTHTHMHAYTIQY